MWSTHCPWTPGRVKLAEKMPHWRTQLKESTEQNHWFNLLNGLFELHTKFSHILMLSLNWFMINAGWIVQNNKSELNPYKATHIYFFLQQKQAFLLALFSSDFTVNNSWFRESSSSFYSVPLVSSWDFLNAFVEIDSRIPGSHVYANVLVYFTISWPIPTVCLLPCLLSFMEAGLRKNA